LFIFYTNNNYTNSIRSGEYDTIQFYGYDDVNTNEIKTNWTVYVYNTIDFSYGGSMMQLYPSSFSITFTNYRPVAKFYLEVTNGKSSKEIYSTDKTNEINVYVFNTTTVTNDVYINSIRFQLPWVINTNTLYISTLRGITNWYISNGYVYIDYTGKEIGKNTNDKIYLKYVDNVENVSTNYEWNFEAKYNITYDKYKSMELYPGKTKYISYIMPQANCLVAVSPNNVSRDLIYNKYVLEITNIAQEINNNIYQIVINSLGVFTNFVYISNYNLSYNPVIEYTNSNLVITYTNGLLKGAGDTIEFIAFDNVENEDFRSNWIIEVDNTTDFSSKTIAGVIPSKSVDINIFAYSYSFKCNLEFTNAKSLYDLNYIYTTIETNYMKLFITNVSYESENNIEKNNYRITMGCRYK